MEANAKSLQYAYAIDKEKIDEKDALDAEDKGQLSKVAASILMGIL